MAQDADNVRVAFTGALYVADTSATGPTDATTALVAGFVEVGYLSDAGVVVAHNDEFTELKAWQGATVVRKTLTSSDVTFEFTMIETKQSSVELYYKKSLETANDELLESSPVPLRQSFVLDVIDGANIHRMYLPSGEVTERSDLSLTNEDAIGYGVTLTAYESAGVKVHHFWDAALPV